MIKIANNLQALVKASNEGDSNIMRDLGLLGLGGAGIGGLTLAANKHRKHWMKNLDGSYTRRMSTLADRPSPQNPFGRPTNYTADGRPIYSGQDFNPFEAHGSAYDSWQKLQKQMALERKVQGRINPATLQKAREAMSEIKRLNTTYGLANEYGVPTAKLNLDTPTDAVRPIAPPSQQRIRIDEAALRNASSTPGQERIRIDEAALRGPKPPTSVFTDPDLFSNIFKRLRRFGR